MASIDFFAVSSLAAVAKMDALLRANTSSDVLSVLLEQIETSAASELPALLRAVSQTPSTGGHSINGIAKVLSRKVTSTSISVDIAWTWAQAWVSIATTPSEFVAPFRTEATREKFRSSFLLSELARATVIQAHPSAPFFLAPAIAELWPTGAPTGADATEFGINVARLIYGATSDSVTESAALALADGCVAAGAEAFAALQEESDICAAVIDKQETRGTLFDGLTPREIATAVALQEIRRATQLRDTELAWSEPAKDRYVRMDELVSALVNATAQEAIPELLHALAADQDLFLRCAVVHHAFAYGLATGPLSKSSAHKLREVVHGVVTTALSKGAHHWLRAAVIHAHCDNFSKLASLPIEMRWSAPAISTLGIEDALLQRGVENAPGLAVQIERFKVHHKRVALVLPSIDAKVSTTSGDERRQVNQGSPPLGLGQIATHLGSLGHLVRLYDAHRYLYDTTGLARELAGFDYVGVSVVFSTIQSAASLIGKIRELGGVDGPKIVVGGHAPTLMTESRIKTAGIDFDYLVVGPGEEAFEYILSDEQRDGNPHVVIDRVVASLIETPTSTAHGLATARSTASARYQVFIENLPWLERRVFADPLTGQAYEPSTTRNLTDVEAHLVLSRGCDWRCSFCTEALIAGRQGENRRSVADLMGEIEHLVRHNGVNRLQFIDDNVFPTLPVYKRSLAGHEANAVTWVESFLNSLAAKAEGRAHQKWRGLMRAEDFLRYEVLIPQFVERLTASGCNLLAFGFECGSEKARAAMKGGKALALTNTEIIGMVARLRGAGIFVKGYFIIGGPDQTKADIDDTIAFAQRCGVDLAYFAIYKDFRGIAQTARRSQDDSALRFSLFPAEVLDQAANGISDTDWERKFGTGIPREDRRSHANALKMLHEAGFSFSHLVRYNDYHEWIAPYSEMGFADHVDYFRKLCEAYLRFYARLEWVDRYKALVDSGY